MTNAQTIRELMTKWNEYSAKWMAEFGTMEGFSEWFTKQVAG